jgi:hypothetical protein
MFGWSAVILSLRRISMAPDLLTSETLRLGSG